MAEPDLRRLVDDLKAHNDQERQRLTSAAAASSAPSNPLNLRFVAGARVLDLVTGKRGLVQRAGRDAATNAELYHVQLGDARVVFRGKDELEPDPTPAPGV